MEYARVRPIKGVEAYQSALSRIESLMDIENRSQFENEELDVLATLVEAYEDQHFRLPSQEMHLASST